VNRRKAATQERYGERGSGRTQNAEPAVNSRSKMQQAGVTAARTNEQEQNNEQTKRWWCNVVAAVNQLWCGGKCR